MSWRERIEFNCEEKPGEKDRGTYPSRRHCRRPNQRRGNCIRTDSFTILCHPCFVLREPKFSAHSFYWGRYWFCSYSATCGFWSGPGDRQTPPAPARAGLSDVGDCRIHGDGQV